MTERLVKQELRQAERAGETAWKASIPSEIL